MPVFKAHIPADRFSGVQKRQLADALNHSLVEALAIPEDDRFVILSEHGPDDLFLHPTFMGMERNAANVMIIEVMIGAHRPLEQKRRLAQAINMRVVDALGVSPDDIFIVIVPLPNENFSFGKGELQLSEGAPQW